MNYVFVVRETCEIQSRTYLLLRPVADLSANAAAGTWLTILPALPASSKSPDIVVVLHIRFEEQVNRSCGIKMVPPISNVKWVIYKTHVNRL